MTVRIVRISLAMTLWVALLTGLLFALNLGRIVPIDDTQFITEVTLCAETGAPAPCQDIALPYHSERPLENRTETRTFVTQLRRDPASVGLHALYLPKLADTVTVEVNGETLFEPRAGRRLWSAPLLIAVPAALLGEDTATLTLTLQGPAP